MSGGRVTRHRSCERNGMRRENGRRDRTGKRGIDARAENAPSGKARVVENRSEKAQQRRSLIHRTRVSSLRLGEIPVRRGKKRTRRHFNIFSFFFLILIPGMYRIIMCYQNGRDTDPSRQMYLYDFLNGVFRFYCNFGMFSVVKVDQATKLFIDIFIKLQYRCEPNFD